MAQLHHVEYITKGASSGQLSEFSKDQEVAAAYS